jgi:hypothetical protein
LPNKQLPAELDGDASIHATKYSSKVGYAARLVTQGSHRFYTLTMPSDVLADTCVVDTREENSDDGFQRVLDQKRAQEIADYIDKGFGTIPCSIVLSAQREANLEYNSRTQVLSFIKTPRAFLILDGQHRVFGFKKAKTRLRVPVVIYNGLRKAETIWRSARWVTVDCNSDVICDLPLLLLQNETDLAMRS